MADRTVNIEFRTSGTDAASRQVAGIGTAAEGAQKKLEALHGAQGRVAGDLRRNDLLDEAFDPQPPGMVRGRRMPGAEPTAVQEARLRGDAQRNRVRLEEQLRRDQEKFEKDQAKDEGPGGLAGLRGSLRGTGLNRLVMPLFLAHAAGQAVAGVGRGLEDISQAPTTAAQAWAMLNQRLGESIPIIGGFVRGIEMMGEALSGASARRAGIAEFLSGSGRQMDFAGFARGQQFTAGERAFEAGRQRADLAGSAVEAQAFLGSLTPAALASFRPVGPTGEIETRVGEAERARLRAVSRETEAQRRVAARQADLAAAEGGMGQLNARSAELRGEVVRGVRGAELLRQDVANFPGGGMPGFGLTPAGQLQTRLAAGAGELAAGAATGAAQLAENELAIARQREQVEKRIGDLTKEQQAAAKARLDVNRAEIDVDRARLAVDEQRIGRLRQGAEQAGAQSPLENQADLELARFARQNPRGLTPQQWGSLRGNPIYAEFAQNTLRQLGQEDPAAQQGMREFGGGKTLEEAETARNRTLDDLTKRLAAAEAEGAKKFADAFGNSFDKLIDAIIGIAEARIGAKANELENKKLREQAQAH